MLDRCPKLKFKFDSRMARLLKSRGVEGLMFAGSKNRFEFDISAVRIKPDIHGVVVKGISVKKQIRHLDSLFKNPFRNNPIIGIGSFPTDLRAKLLATNLMERAITFQEASKTRKMSNREYPLWHKVYGGFRDKVRDREVPENISMLIISNIDVDSTKYKIEKVRDLLEMYSNIPRVVVVSGTDPMSFFANKLHIPMNFGFYMGADNRQNKINVLDAY